MATKKKITQETETGGGETLKEAAKVVGTALGAIAAKTGIAKAPKKSSGRFVKKDKKRLPRKQKKQAKKLAKAKA
jgi:hypothetical protein